MDGQNWISNPQPKLPYHDCVNNCILRQQSIIPDLMPDLRQAEKLYVTSDYGGDIGISRVLSYSFLFIDVGSFEHWDGLQKVFREETSANTRLFKYSNITDEEIPFLEILLKIAGQLSGLLITFVVSKELESLHGSKGLLDYDQLQTEPFVDYTAEDKEKIFRIGSLMGLVMGALTKENQSILWIPDKDNTTNNIIRLPAVRNKIKDITGNMREHKLTWNEPNDLVEAQSTLHIEDLNSIADLAAGSSARYFSARIEQNLMFENLITPAWPTNLPDKVRPIINWLLDASNLKKKTFYFFKADQKEDKQLRDLAFYFNNIRTF